MIEYLPPKPKLYFAVAENGNDVWDSNRFYFARMLEERFALEIHSPNHFIITPPVDGVDFIGYTQVVKPFRRKIKFYFRNLMRYQRNMYTIKKSIFRK